VRERAISRGRKIGQFQEGDDGDLEKHFSASVIANCDIARRAISKASGRANLARLPIELRAIFLIVPGHFLPAGSALRTTAVDESV